MIGMTVIIAIPDMIETTAEKEQIVNVPAAVRSNSGAPEEMKDALTAKEQSGTKTELARSEEETEKEHAPVRIDVAHALTDRHALNVHAEIVLEAAPIDRHAVSAHAKTGTEMAA